MIVVRTRRPRSQTQRRVDLDDVYRALMTGGNVTGGRPGRAWRPPIDVYETEDALEITVEIAGLDRDEIELMIDGDMLSLRGHRGDHTVCDHRSFHEARIHYGEFAVDVFIPVPVDVERAEAVYENGFLRISLPRARSRTIIPTRASSEHEHATPTEDPDRRNA